jgi:hypothetical protein
LLNAAFDAAVEGERRHRKMGRGMRGYRQSVKTTARYFVVKWFSEAPGKVTNARQACAWRLDCLYATALRECLDAHGITIDLGTDVNGIDYCTDIVG